MESEEKRNTDGKSKETGFGFPFGSCQEMFEMMRTCCEGESKVFDCCPMMGRMKDQKSSNVNKK